MAETLDFTGFGIPFDTEVVTITGRAAPPATAAFTIPGGTRRVAFRVTISAAAPAWGVSLRWHPEGGQIFAVHQFSEDGERFMCDVSPSVMSLSLQQVTLAVGQALTATAVYFY